MTYGRCYCVFLLIHRLSEIFSFIAYFCPSSPGGKEAASSGIKSPWAPPPSATPALLKLKE